MIPCHRIKINDYEIGDQRPCFFIAEIGLNHNGDVTLAHQLIEEAAKSGADMVKFQKRSPADLAIAVFLDAPFPKCPQFGSTQRQVRERLELSFDALYELKKHAEDLKILFSMSVFDLPSLRVAQTLQLSVLKIASHSITNAPLLEAVAATRLPVMASLGASDWEERDKACQLLKKNDIVLLHCVSAYPCPDAIICLDTMAELKRRYRCPVGYSGHETGLDVSIAAAVLGAAAIERHFTLDRSMVGLDHKLSLVPKEFAELVQRVRRLEKVRGISKGIAEEEKPARSNYHVSVCTRRKVKQGDTFQADDIVCKQPLGEPGLFFNGFELKKVIGKKALYDLEADQSIPKSAVK